MADANRQAQEIIAAAKDKAERIRAESERELAAATQRRDSINAQLTNVRQMLATLSGSPAMPLDLLGEEDSEADCSQRQEELASSSTALASAEAVSP